MWSESTPVLKEIPFKGRGHLGVIYTDYWCADHAEVIDAVKLCFMWSIRSKFECWRGGWGGGENIKTVHMIQNIKFTIFTMTSS